MTILSQILSCGDYVYIVVALIMITFFKSLLNKGNSYIKFVLYILITVISLWIVVHIGVDVYHTLISL